MLASLSGHSPFFYSARRSSLLVLHLNFVYGLQDLGHLCGDLLDSCATDLRTNFAGELNDSVFHVVADTRFDVVLDERGVEIVFDGLVDIGADGLGLVIIGRGDANFVGDDFRADGGLCDRRGLRFRVAGGGRESGDDGRVCFLEDFSLRFMPGARLVSFRIGFGFGLLLHFGSAFFGLGRSLIRSLLDDLAGVLCRALDGMARVLRSTLGLVTRVFHVLLGRLLREKNGRAEQTQDRSHRNLREEVHCNVKSNHWRGR
jgi:hypothetical protein